MPIAMPGLTSNMDINGIIKKLVKVKRAPVKRIEEEIDRLTLEKDIWKNIRKKLKELGDISKGLYDYTSPFRVMGATSSQKESFTATVNRKAKKSKRKIQVLRLASAHCISSDSIMKTKTLKSSVFHVSVGKKKAKIDFSEGGTIRDLYLKLEDKVKDFVKVSLTYDTSDTAILVLKAVKTGLGNNIGFSGDKKTLLQIGLLGKMDGKTLSIPLADRSMFGKYEGVPGNYGNSFQLSSGMLLLQQNSRVEKVLPKSISKKEYSEITLEVKYDLDTQATNIVDGGGGNGFVADPSKVKLGEKSPVNIEDIKIFGSGLIPNEKLLPKKPVVKKPITPQKKAAMENFFVVVLVDKKGGIRREFKVKCAQQPGKWQKISMRLDGYDGLDAVTRIAFFNDNNGVKIAYRNALAHAAAKGGYGPKNVISKPQDSLLTIDGIKVRRKGNKIDDLVDGVILNLHQRGKEGTLSVDHDYDMVAKYIYKFIEKYNKTLMYLNAVSKRLSPEERKQHAKSMKSKTDLTRALEDKNKAEMDLHLGKLTGDMTISRLRSAMRMIMMSAYPTRLERKLALLVQIGISTGKVGAKWSDLKSNKGALELDTTKLKVMLEKDLIAVSQLFGNDTNGDKIPDRGVSLRFYRMMRTYVQAGNSGIVAVKLKYYDRVIKDKRRSKDRAERSVKSYEDRLRQQFLNMETRNKRYRSQSRWLNQGQNGKK